jgi:DNA polymerase-1
MEYREMQYLSRNLIDGFGKFILEDGRVHPNILLFGTVTGRLAIREPAVQTIPKHSKNAKAIRRIFLPDIGDVIIDVDYSNLELYMAHHLTGDEALLEALQKDLHRMTAAAMYMKDYEEVSDAERQSAKPVNFGAGYNIGAGKLSRDINLIGITGGQKSKAQAFLDAFWSKYTTWDKGRHEWMREALENCELRTELGRVRRWSLITKDNLWKVNNQACNFKGQSMASDLCLTSLIRLQEELTERGLGRVMLTVHDSLVFSIHKDKVHEAVPIIKEIMTTPIFETKTPFKVDVQVGLNYGDMDSYDPNKDYTLI